MSLGLAAAGVIRRRPRPRRRGRGALAPEQVERNLAIMESFIEAYCREHHGRGRGQLCPECAELLVYARGRLERCPYDPKPACKDCPTHCYKPDKRALVREVMRSSGLYFVKRGRLDWLVRYFLAG